MALTGGVANRWMRTPFASRLHPTFSFFLYESNGYRRFFPNDWKNWFWTAPNQRRFVVDLDHAPPSLLMAHFCGLHHPRLKPLGMPQLRTDLADQLKLNFRERKILDIVHVAITKPRKTAPAPPFPAVTWSTADLTSMTAPAQYRQLVCQTSSKFLRDTPYHFQRQHKFARAKIDRRPAPRSTVLELAITLLGTPIFARSQAALIISNGMYLGNSRLENPVRDAENMAEKLRK